LVEIEGPSVGDPATTLGRWERIVDGEIVFVGDGAEQYGDVIRSRQSDARIIDATPLASAIGLMAVARAGAGGNVDPADVRPLYVRRPDAEVDRERKKALPQRTQRTQS
jgi:tRNA A37 threonylcarbamoyladenosine modification protein TsaB